ncbi:5-deoxy-glucuronate isomerase [Nakamurella flava]|uniref:5-deoxy-glucuronate isomerase n=1 Tax=Nakamurella flava TaxID=2576308 RepID=A0A4U6QMT1_9ACTN|nr:5-deoxy-glucuronate isomerase [Nakamurella flava]TKV61741.1 5-deoxy-glucuronate isomerase [Nakamurella flava]
MTGSVAGRTPGLYLPAGSTAQSPYDLVITPETAGWGYSSLRILTMEPGESHTFSTGGEEMIALPLAGSCDVTVGEETFSLAGRESVFTATTDLAYLPIGSEVTIHSPGGITLALPGTVVDRELPFRYQPASGTSVVLRGAGSHTRQVNDFAMATGMQCAKMLATEVITPASNWSSYPPHKHDEKVGDETELEEIYYFRFASAAPDDAPELARTGRPVGYQRVFGTDERPVEVLEEVSDGDTVLVPHGWHGPAIASPSHHMYYLNVMAGPGDERAWGISDHPEHGWVRATWADQPTDPRLPLYEAATDPDDSQRAGVDAR